jgi:hypothetical protein
MKEIIFPLTLFSLLIIILGSDQKKINQTLIEKSDPKLRLKRSVIITEADVLSKLKKIDDAIGVLDDNLAEVWLRYLKQKKVFSNII